MLKKFSARLILAILYQSLARRISASLAAPIGTILLFQQLILSINL
jgi:hypothetical protein